MRTGARTDDDAPLHPQWFGNLVTMEWWTHLWLNEGFATWAGWLATDRAFPQWRVFDQFVVTEQARGLDLDGLRSSHPVEARASTTQCATTRMSSYMLCVVRAGRVPPLRAAGGHPGRVKSNGNLRCDFLLKGVRRGAHAAACRAHCSTSQDTSVMAPPILS